MKKKKKKEPNEAKEKLYGSDKVKQASCPHCKMYTLYSDGRFGWNSKSFEIYAHCFRIKAAKKPDERSMSSNSAFEQSADIGIFVAHVSATAASNEKNYSHVTLPMLKWGQKN